MSYYIKLRTVPGTTSDTEEPAGMTTGPANCCQPHSTGDRPPTAPAASVALS